jgi:uncharacterized CHY-type Zn-finger protein
LELHAARHANPSEEERRWRREHLERIRPLASAWHQSAEGRQWHSALGRLSWADRGSRAFVCEHCGARFESYALHGKTRFCSNACRAAARRAAGADNEERICGHCGKSFTVNRYSKARACSRSCAYRLRGK